MNHSLRCECGAVRGVISETRRSNRGVCYCRDCQAFAHFLGRADSVLDAQGGTDVVQIVPANLMFSSGQEHLACVRLSPKGLVRWYANCCKTPIGNTVANPQIAFIGLVHNCLEAPGQSLDDSFGPVRMISFPESAKGVVESDTLAFFAGVARIFGMVVRARLNGDYKRTPLFVLRTGAPIATPKILSPAEREALYKNLTHSRGTAADPERGGARPSS